MIPWRWVVGAVAIGVLIGWYLRTPTVRVEERIVKQEVIRWQAREKVVTKPGAVVYLTRSADGSETTRIEGPVEIGRESEGSASTLVDSSRKESKCPEWPKYAILGGVNLGMDGSMSNGILVGTRLVGPFWGYCGGFFPPVKGVVMIGVSF